MAAIARQFGFQGRIEYRHVYSESGGAQYGIGPRPSSDLLIVYAEAFDREADPEDFSLEAILAHERGHQVLSRHPGLRGLLGGKTSLVVEEVLASLIGSLIASASADRESLVLKAAADAVESGMKGDEAVQLVGTLRDYLESLL